MFTNFVETDKGFSLSKSVYFLRIPSFPLTVWAKLRMCVDCSFQHPFLLRECFANAFHIPATVAKWGFLVLMACDGDCYDNSLLADLNRSYLESVEASQFKYTISRSTVSLQILPRTSNLTLLTIAWARSGRIALIIKKNVIWRRRHVRWRNSISFQLQV